MKTFRCEFLGCKVNQYDAEQARKQLLEHGFEETPQEASVLLLASCTVTSTAASKGRHAVRSVLRRHPAAQVVVMGCFTEDDRAMYRSIAPGVTFLPSARSDAFLETMAPLLGTPPARPWSAPPRRTRAYLKVEDGCDLSCSFCIIPSVRGRARSRAPDALVAEVNELVAAGTREIVLTGVHLGHYGRRQPYDLVELLDRLIALPGDFRLRLSSLEVTELTPSLIDRIERSGRIANHLHLPLQSGSDSTLKAMRRPYSAERFRSTVAEVRGRIPQLSITTDVIVGFPGETDADFEASLEMCRFAAFTKLHIFPFSLRRGTHAETLGDPVPGTTIKERKRRLFELDAALLERSLRGRIGDRVQIVAETERSDGSLTGFDERYHRTTIRTPHGGALGEFVSGRVTAVEGQGLLAEACA
jgi:threonylcarbamoyladenosine tRNA methylthiotransferase MtaB